MHCARTRTLVGMLAYLDAARPTDGSFWSFIILFTTCLLGVQGRIAQRQARFISRAFRSRTIPARADAQLCKSCCSIECIHLFFLNFRNLSRKKKTPVLSLPEAIARLLKSLNVSAAPVRVLVLFALVLHKCVQLSTLIDIWCHWHC